MTKNSSLLLCVFFGFFALSLMAPLASNHYAPANDFIYHAKGIVFAKNALLEHQFPIRIAPLVNDSPRYPLFQFYSPLPYMLTGFLHIFLHNPYLPYKLFTFLAILLGGFYMYRLVDLLLQDKKVALLAGLAYQFSPYWIINTNVRTDFTESLAQGLLPLALFYTVSVFQRYALKHFLLAALMWGCLAMTHLVTFAFASVFLFLWLGMWALREKQYIPALVKTSATLVFGYALAAWYLIPLVLYNGILKITPPHGQVNPTWSDIFTPLATLLSTQALSPLPLPGGGELGTEYLYAAVGYPVLIGLGILIYAFFKDRRFYQQQRLLFPLALCFVLAFFATWSPVDIWKHLPNFLSFFQYTYRFLAQVMWLGVLLFAYALHWLFKNRLDNFTLMILIGIIVIGNSFWLHSQKNDGTTLTSIMNHYQDYDGSYYQVNPKHVRDAELLANSKLSNNCYQQNAAVVCNLDLGESSAIALPMLWYPKMIRLSVDQAQTAYRPTVLGDKVLVGVEVDKGIHTISASFTGLNWANWLSVSAWLILLAGLNVPLITKRFSRPKA